MLNSLSVKLITLLKNHQSSNQAGFHLAEAVTTIAVGMTLTAIAIPSYSTFRTAFSARATTVQNSINSDATSYSTNLSGMTNITPAANTTF